MPDYVKTVGLFYLLVFSDINKSKNLLTSLLGIDIIKLTIKLALILCISLDKKFEDLFYFD